MNLAARKEWSGHWSLVLAAMSGMSLTSLALYSIGIFMDPVANDLHWNRAQIAAGLTIFSVLSVPASPFVGILIDRWGARALAIPGTILTGIAFAAFGFVGASPIDWLVLWIFYTVASLAIKAAVWTAGVSAVFSVARGLALAATLSGAALAQIAAPPITRFLIDAIGWRHAFVTLGLGWAGAVLCLLPFFRTSRAAGTVYVGLVSEGLSLKEALRDPAMLRIAASAFLSTMLLIALVFNQVPMLSEMGIPRAMGARLASLGGAAALLGKILSGWLLDRGDRAATAAASVLPAGLACAILLMGSVDWRLDAVASVLIGYAIGAYLQVIVYFTTRYGGMRHYGKIFGCISSLLGFGSGIGPVIGAAIFDRSGSYRALLIGGIPTAILSATLITGLGSYPGASTLSRPSQPS